MSAYLKELDRRCSQCDKRATVEVFNTWNGSIGVYCRPHGERKVRELQASERR